MQILIAQKWKLWKHFIATTAIAITITISFIMIISNIIVIISKLLLFSSDRGGPFGLPRKPADRLRRGFSHIAIFLSVYGSDLRV